MILKIFGQRDNIYWTLFLYLSGTIANDDFLHQKIISVKRWFITSSQRNDFYIIFTLLCYTYRIDLNYHSKVYIEVRCISRKPSSYYSFIGSKLTLISIPGKQ